MENRLLMLCLLLASTALATSDQHIEALCRTSDLWTLWPHKHCQKFYLCTGSDEGTYQEYSCPSEYHFSHNLSICVPGACTKEASECSSKHSVLRVASDCSKYVECLHAGSYSIASCPAGNYFDAGRRACLPVDITTGHQCSCVLPENATLANPSDCETYFRCRSGEAELVQCPPGDYFSASANSCLPDHTGICLQKPTLPPGLSVQAQALDECIRTGGRVAPHSRNCQRFFVCAPRRVLEMRCPRGQYFDALLRHCRLDLDNECRGLEAEKQLKEEPKGQKIKQKQEQNPEAAEQKVTVEQPTTEREHSYDKFSSKFVTFINE